jgi:hypothetical protein
MKRVLEEQGYRIERKEEGEYIIETVIRPDGTTAVKTKTKRTTKFRATKRGKA